MTPDTISTFAIGGGVVSDGERVFLPDGAIVIDKGKILRILPSIEAKRTTERFIDVEGRLILPGFVNFHHHLYSYFAVGLKPCGRTDTFTQVLENFWWKLDRVLVEESVFFSALLGLAESLKNGTTTVFDHHASMGYVTGSLETVARAFSETGIRGALCFETSDRFGTAEAYRHIEENSTFCRNHMEDGMIRGLFGLHASLTLSEETLREVARNRPDGIPVHVHCAEAPDDVDVCRSLGYSGAVERLSAHGLLGPSSILAHAVHLSTRDLEILHSVNPLVVTNPESNANNGVGKMDRDAVSRYLLGTDGMTGDMVQSLRSYVLLGKGGRESVERTGDMFFKHRREALSRFFPAHFGFEAGAAADITVPDYVPLTPVRPESIIDHLVFGAKRGPAFMTVVDGRVLWREGHFAHLDENAMRREGIRVAAALHEKYSHLLRR